MENSIIKQNLPQCGEVWLCALRNSNKHSVQSGYRPVYILSNNYNNSHSTTVNVIPFTSKHKNKLPIHVEVEAMGGLKTASVMLVEQIMTIPISQLDRCIGKISDTQTIKNIREAIKIQFPIVS